MLAIPSATDCSGPLLTGSDMEQDYCSAVAKKQKKEGNLKSLTKLKPMIKLP